MLSSYQNREFSVNELIVAASHVIPGYAPEQTRLLGDARGRGARVVTGKWMLVYQAAEQFELWTGRDAPVEAMAEAFDRVGS